VKRFSLSFKTSLSASLIALFMVSAPIADAQSESLMIFCHRPSQAQNIAD
jgi:hypothetical protein